MGSLSQTGIEQIVQKHLLPSSHFIYGFADLRGLLIPEFAGFSSGISIGKKLDDNILDSIETGPTLGYYEHYREMNLALEQIIDAICVDLRQNKVNCMKVSPTVVMTSEEFRPYLKELRYKLSHKMVATRAGLGWIGKTDLFVSKAFGPRLRLASILIDRKLKSENRPIDKSRCGSCTVCVDKCPAHAANGRLWDIHTDRDLFLDAEKCREQCGRFGMELFMNETRICGICVSVCPPGRNRQPV
ncbi:MAG: 4Fe-4S double cluster binding domain-containing protein [Bacteroidota bacterium]